MYLPSADKLREGLVWKYYYHSGKVGNGAKTDIKYLKCTLLGDTLRHEEYDAAFQNTRSYDLLLDGESWITLSDRIIIYRSVKQKSSMPKLSLQILKNGLDTKRIAGCISIATMNELWLILKNAMLLLLTL